VAESAAASSEHVRSRPAPLEGIGRRERVTGARAGFRAAGWAAARTDPPSALRTPYSTAAPRADGHARPSLARRRTSPYSSPNRCRLRLVFGRLGMRGRKQGVLAAEAENLVLWPLMLVVGRVHPECRDRPLAEDSHEPACNRLRGRDARDLRSLLGRALHRRTPKRRPHALNPKSILLSIRSMTRSRSRPLNPTPVGAEYRSANSSERRLGTLKALSSKPPRWSPCRSRLVVLSLSPVAQRRDTSPTAGIRVLEMAFRDCLPCGCQLGLS